MRYFCPENCCGKRVPLMEIFGGVCADSALLRSIYKCYDKMEHSTGIRYMRLVIGCRRPQAVGMGVNPMFGHIHQGREAWTLVASEA